MMNFDRRQAITGSALSIAALTSNPWAAAHAQPAAPGAASAPRTTKDPRAQNRTYRYADANQDMPYCIYVSSKVSKDKPAPLIITLHGLGSGPDIMCNKAAVDLAEDGGYILAAPMGYSTSGWYGTQPPGGGGGRGAPPAGPAATAAPAGPSAQDIAQWSEQDVMNVLAMMRTEFNVDSKRIYLTGHSMGGAGTYFIGSKHADIWAAIAPVAPASFSMNNDRAAILKRLKDANVPILVVQGDIDELVPVANTRMWVETMKDLGMTYEYLEQPGITHGPVIMNSQAAVYAFLAKHAKA